MAVLCEILPFFQFFLNLKSTSNSIEFSLHAYKPRDQYTNSSMIKTSKDYIRLEVAARYARLLLVPAGGMPASRAGGLRPPPPLPTYISSPPNMTPLNLLTTQNDTPCISSLPNMTPLYLLTFQK